MDAVKFIKESKRLCKAQESCNKCVVKIGGCCITDIFAEENLAEKTVAIVEQWAKDHPVKTRQSKFLKMFPEVPMKDDVIDICPATVVNELKNAEHCNHILCEDCRKTFWLIEVSE